MIETTQMSKEVRKITLILTLIVSGVSLFVFQGSFSQIGVGIFIGALTGLMGFNMIVKMTGNIEYYGDAQKKGHGSYVQRYAIYTLIFALSAYKGVDVFALLAGMLCHKASIFIYVFLHRKEDDEWNS